VVFYEVTACLVMSILPDLSPKPMPVGHHSFAIAVRIGVAAQHISRR